LKVFTCFVNSAMRKGVRHAFSKQCGQQEEFTDSVPLTLTV
jgi:hypothetical protein